MPKWPEADASLKDTSTAFIAEWLYWPTWWPADRILVQAQGLVNTLNTTGEKLEDMTKSLKAW